MTLPSLSDASPTSSGTGAVNFGGFTFGGGDDKQLVLLAVVALVAVALVLKKG